MKTVLSALAILGVLFVLCVGAWQYSLHRQANSPEGLAAAKEESDALAIWTANNVKRGNLEKDRCEAPVNALLALNRGKRITAVTDIPAQMRSDIEFCLGRNIMAGYAKDELNKVGLLKLFDES
jgi:hypothetical protein